MQPNMQPDQQPSPDRRISTNAVWADSINLLWGLWLLTSPASLGYTAETGLTQSDLIIGTLVLMFATLSICTGSNFFRWANCLLGLWLIFSPLWFWTASPAAYSNNTLLGCLIVGFSGYNLGKSVYSESLKEVPNDWSYNPSNWTQRIPIIGLAFLGFFSARYMAAYQLGHLNTVWEPFFGEGTATILKSDISKAFPVSDAGLGAFSYLLDALAGAMGDRRRWRTMPWMVILFGIMIIPPGVTSITLVILQPIAVGAWCSLCLFTAFIMLLMVPPAIDEVVASLQFLAHEKKAGKSFWKLFWRGDQPEQVPSLVTVPLPSPTDALKIYQPQTKPWKLPWSYLLSTFIGIWLMFTPSLFVMNPTISNHTHMIAALVITFSIIAFAEVGRPCRWILLLLGIWLVAVSQFFSGSVALTRWNGTICGLALCLLSPRVGPVRRSYGTYDRWIYWHPFMPKKKSRRTSQAA